MIWSSCQKLALIQVTQQNETYESLHKYCSVVDNYAYSCIVIRSKQRPPASASAAAADPLALAAISPVIAAAATPQLKNLSPPNLVAAAGEPRAGHVLRI